MEQYNSEPVSIINWLITLIILMIPVVNIIMLLVWAFAPGTNPSKANYCKASLIVFLVIFAIAGAMVALA